MSSKRRRRPMSKKLKRGIAYWSHCQRVKQRHMETGKIRFVLLDPLSRRAIYRGTIHIEYVNQDPDRVEPINIEKISQRYEWEGTKSDWFGLFVVVIILIIAATMYYLQSPWASIQWQYLSPAQTTLVWKLAFATWSFTGSTPGINMNLVGDLSELNLLLLETFILIITKISPIL